MASRPNANSVFFWLAVALVIGAVVWVAVFVIPKGLHADAVCREIGGNPTTRGSLCILPTGEVVEPTLHQAGGSK